MFVNPIACIAIIPAVLALLPHDRPAAVRANFDLVGGMLASGGMLALVFALVKAPNQGWGAAMTWWEFAGAAVLLAAFLVNERLVRNPLLPLSLFRTRGMLAADIAGFVGFSGMLAMFYFLTLYMQNVLGYSPITAGAAYLPLTLAVGVSSGMGAKLLSKVGSRPVIMVGALICRGPSKLVPADRRRAWPGHHVGRCHQPDHAPDRARPRPGARVHERLPACAADGCLAHRRRRPDRTSGRQYPR